MKKLLITITALALSATMATAGSWPKPKPTPAPTASASASASASAHQRQGQHQGQLQGQSQGIHQEFGGSIAAPGMGGQGDLCASLGVGEFMAVAGFCVPSATMNSVKVSALLIQLGDHHSARTILLNTPVARRALRSQPATRNTYGKSTVKADPVVVRAAVPYAKCGHNADGAVVFKRKQGHTSAVARSACLASLGY